MEQTGHKTPANDIAALLHEQVVNVPDDNYRNPSREANISETY